MSWTTITLILIGSPLYVYILCYMISSAVTKGKYQAIADVARKEMSNHGQEQEEER